jgi:hypothetical protein
MNEETKKQVHMAFDLLRGVLVKNGCSLATDKDGRIYVFSTKEYEKKGRLDLCSGFVVDIRDLVR